MGLMPPCNFVLKITTMPEVSRFYGIVIALYYNEHNPPHFHAKYGEYKAEIDIRTLQIQKVNYLNVQNHWFWSGQMSTVEN